MGAVGLDGTKINANASRHSALSWEHAGKLEGNCRPRWRTCWRAPRRRPGRRPRRPVDFRRAGLAREASGQARGGAREDRGAGEGALRARAGRARGQARRARGQDRRDRQEARRQTACAAGRRAAAKDQINLTDEDCASCPLRAAASSSLQRASRRGRGEPFGRCRRWGSGAQRQAAARTDAGPDRGFARTPGRGRNALGRHRLFRRGECRGLPGGQRRTADRHGPSAASSAAWRALREGGAPPENPTPVEAMAHG